MYSAPRLALGLYVSSHIVSLTVVVLDSVSRFLFFPSLLGAVSGRTFATQTSDVMKLRGCRIAGCCDDGCCMRLDGAGELAVARRSADVWLLGLAGFLAGSGSEVY